MKQTLPSATPKFVAVANTTTDIYAVLGLSNSELGQLLTQRDMQMQDYQRQWLQQQKQIQELKEELQELKQQMHLERQEKLQLQKENQELRLQLQQQQQQGVIGKLAKPPQPPPSPREEGDDYLDDISDYNNNNETEEDGIDHRHHFTREPSPRIEENEDDSSVDHRHLSTSGAVMAAASSASATAPKAKRRRIVDITELHSGVTIAKEKQRMETAEKRMMFAFSYQKNLADLQVTKVLQYVEAVAKRSSDELPQSALNIRMFDKKMGHDSLMWAIALGSEAQFLRKHDKLHKDEDIAVFVWPDLCKSGNRGLQLKRRLVSNARSAYMCYKLAPMLVHSSLSFNDVYYVITYPRFEFILKKWCADPRTYEGILSTWGLLDECGRVIVSNIEKAT